MTLVTVLQPPCVEQFLRSAFRARSSVLSGRTGVSIAGGEEREPAVGTIIPDGPSIRGNGVVFSLCSTLTKGVTVWRERGDPLNWMRGKSLEPVMRLWYRLITESLMESMLVLLRGRFLRLVSISWRTGPGWGRASEWKVKRRKTLVTWVRMTWLMDSSKPRWTSQNSCKWHSSFHTEQQKNSQQDLLWKTLFKMIHVFQSQDE